MSAVRKSGLGTRQVRVAALIIGGIVLLAFAVYQVGKILDVFADRYTLVTLMPSVAGLREGAPVTLAGQQVGQVSKISFIPLRSKHGGNHLALTLEVAERVRVQIRADSRVQIRSQGLLGDKYVDIEPGSIVAAMLQPGDTIQATVSLDMEQFLAKASGSMDQANLIIADLREITGRLSRGEGTLGQLMNDDELYFRMVSATSEMQTLLEEVNTGDGSLGQLIRDPAMYRRMVSAVARVDSLGSSILHGRGTLAQLIRSDSVYKGILGATAGADAAARDLSTMLQRLNRSDGTLNKLMTDPRLFDELLKSVVDLQTLISDVRDNPKKYAPPINVKVF